MCRITLMPAYGRRYDSWTEVLSDWNAGKDFFIHRGAYCSIRDLDAIKQDLGADTIEFVWLSKDATKPMSHVYWRFVGQHTLRRYDY